MLKGNKTSIHCLLLILFPSLDHGNFVDDTKSVKLNESLTKRGIKLRGSMDSLYTIMM